MRIQQNTELADSILNKALELGEASSWENVHLYKIADELNISLNEIKHCYAQKDDIVDAWFDRADHAAITVSNSNKFKQLTINQRLHLIITSWLDALLPHHRLTREMLYYKCEPGHIHLQLSAIQRISRTVQWFRETAQQNSNGIQRIVEEINVSKIYLGAFTRWLCDRSSKKQNSRQYLDKKFH